MLAVCAERGGGGVVEVVLAEDVVGGAGGGVSWAWVICSRFFWDVPYQCPPVGHGAHGAHGPAYAGELEGAGGFGEGFVQAIFVHCAVATGGLLVTGCVEGVVGEHLPPCVNVVAVWAPAGVHAPWRRTAWRE